MVQIVTERAIASGATRISGYHRILRSSQVEVLFDNRLIPFEANGTMQVHPSPAADVCERGSIDFGTHQAATRAVRFS